MRNAVRVHRGGYAEYDMVYETLITLGWADQRKYRSPVNFVIRLNDVASLELMHSLVKDALWNTLNSGLDHHRQHFRYRYTHTAITLTRPSEH